MWDGEKKRSRGGEGYIYIYREGRVDTKIKTVWKPLLENKRRIKEMEIDAIAIVGSPWRKTLILSYQTCSNLYQILRGSSIRQNEHLYGVEFQIQWLVLRLRVPGDPHSCQMDGRTISTNIGSWFNRSTCKRRPDRVSGRTLRWFCQPWLERER